jgi:hypothetical protein
MSNTITFDTLHHFERMIEAGFTEKQAKAQTDAIAQLVDEKLATKSDLKQEIRSLESRITTKLVAITVIIPTILKLLEHFKI